MVRRVWWSRAVQLMGAKTHTKDKKEPEKDNTLQRHDPSKLLLPNRSSFHSLHHLLIVYSNFESTNGLNCCLGQSLHDLILSGITLMYTPRGILCQ
jgi:hypothetical protein